MKILLSLFTLFLIAATVRAQISHPMDSIILESKTVAPSNGPVGMTVRVFITNKDTLGAFGVALGQKSFTGGASAILANPLTYGTFLTRLTATLEDQWAVTTRYDGVGADSFYFFVYTLYSNFEPPNLARKGFLDIKFDTVKPNIGTFELDTIRHPPALYTTFVTTQLQQYPANFLKATITVVPKGDLNRDFQLRTSDLVLLLNCVTLGESPPSGPAFCDVNCDGQSSTADVVLMIRAVFLKEGFPC